MTEIVFPSSLKTINNQAFDGCKNLTNISLGKNVNSLNNMAFYGSGINSMTISTENPNYSVINGALYNKDGTIFISPVRPIGGIAGTYIIPNGVKEIANYAFHYQNNMTSITLPNTLEKIGASFNYCSGLSEIEIPSSVTTINTSCFNSCGNNLKEVIIHKAKGSIPGSPWGLQYGDRGVIWDE